MTAQEIFELRQDIYGNGFRPLAIQHRLKYPTDKGWPDLARQNPPDACVSQPDARSPGTGVLCDGLRPIDIDVEDVDLVDKIMGFAHEHYGDAAPIRYRDNSNRVLLLYAAESGEPHKASCKNKATKYGVEVLGKGNQFFAYGFHPSGVPLQWMNGGPHVTQRSALPTINEAQTIDFIDYCAWLLAADSKSYGNHVQVQKQPTSVIAPQVIAKAASTSQIGVWCIGDVVSALDAIPNYEADYDHWFRIGAAVYAASGGTPDGFNAWRDWSRSCSEHDDVLTTKVWNGYHDGGISGGTLYWAVKQHDQLWDRPSKRFVNLDIFPNN